MLEINGSLPALLHCEPPPMSGDWVEEVAAAHRPLCPAAAAPATVAALGGTEVGARTMKVTCTPGETFMLGVAAGGKVTIRAPGEQVVFSPLHPTWVHLVYPASADLTLAQFGLATPATLEVELASGSVWHSRATPSGRLAPPILRPPAAQTRVEPPGPASRPTRGPHRPPSRRVLDDLIRAHDQTPPLTLGRHPRTQSHSRLKRWGEEPSCSHAT